MKFFKMLQKDPFCNLPKRWENCIGIIYTQIDDTFHAPEASRYEDNWMVLVHIL